MPQSGMDQIVERHRPRHKARSAEHAIGAAATPQSTPEVEAPDGSPARRRLGDRVGTLAVRLVARRLKRPSTGQTRLVRAGFSSMGMALGKLTRVAVSVVTLPLMIHYLGKESYGLAIAIVSFVMLFLVDMGISEGVKVRLIECFARDDRAAARAYVSTGFVGTVLFAMVLGAAFYGAFPFVDWDGVFHLSADVAVSPGQLRLAVALTMALVVLLVPLKMLKEVYTAHQRGYVFSLFIAGGTLLSLPVLASVVSLDLGLIGVVLALQGSLALSYVALAAYFTADTLRWLRPRWRDVRVWALRNMWVDCLMLLLMSLGFMAVNGSDVFIVNHYLGGSEAAVYYVSIRLFVYVDTLLQLVVYPLWPALGDAVQKGQQAWVRKTSRRILVITVATSAVLLGGTVLSGRTITHLWTGGVVLPPWSLYACLAMYYLVRAPNTVYATLLRAHGKIRVQSLAQAAEAVLHLGLCLLLVRHLGLLGMVLGALSALVLTQAWILPLEYWCVCRRAEVPMASQRSSCHV